MRRWTWVLSLTLLVGGSTVTGTLSSDATEITCGYGIASDVQMREAAPASPGDQLWVSRYVGQYGVNESAYALAVSPDGSRVFVTGDGAGGFGQSYDYATVAYDASTGDQLWAATFNGPGDFTDVSLAMAVSPSGSMVFVTGYTSSRDLRRDYATVAYDAVTGSQLWVKLYLPGDQAEAVAVSPDSSMVFVTGQTSGVGRDIATVAYDAVTGETLWVRRFDGPNHGDDFAHGLVVSPDGSRVFVTGSPSSPEYVTIAYEASSGARLWVALYTAGSQRHGNPNAIDVSPDGSRVFVTGRSAGPGLSYNRIPTVAFDAFTGARLWATGFGLENTDDWGYDLSVSPDGSMVYVTGCTASPPQAPYSNFVTIAYDASTGAQRWVTEYNGPTDEADVAAALGVSPDGSQVVVTGYSFQSSLSDYATVGYDASTGSQLWVKRFDATGGTDYPTALSVNPDGSAVYVTGDCYSNNGYEHYVTVAYALT